ncbi:MAG: metallophosphoesterase [Cytophagales bacterium]
MSFSTLLIRLGIFLLILFFIDLYALSGIKAFASSFDSEKTRKLIIYFYWGISVAFLIVFLYTLLTYNAATGPRGSSFKWLSILMVLIWLPKLVFCIFLLFEDVFRLWHAISVFVFDKMGWEAQGETEYFESRRKVVSQIGLAIAAIPFLSVLYGVTKGKYNFKVHNVTLLLKDLPVQFDGFTITQISDVHSGSFDSREDIERGIELINEQKSDIVLFTGDLVNNLASEFDPWVDVFKKIEAPLGKYSSIGNHDYGEYIPWPNEEAKEANFKALQDQHDKMGFKLLMNENLVFTRKNEQIALMGVENWGLPPFPQRGDLELANKGLRNDMFRILMSHDPSHWDAKVLPFREKIHLTLSGHTHGMQFGIEIPGFFKWSPVKYKYPRWADLYQEKDQYLYVNRGFGFLGFAGRIGIWPEITKITLKAAV